MCSEVFHVLKKVVPASGVGDEGGYAPNLDSDEDALKALVKAIELAGYKPYDDFMIAIDSACSEWFNAEDGCYHLPKRGIVMTREQMVDMYADFVEKYPIISWRTAWPRTTGKAGKCSWIASARRSSS